MNEQEQLTMMALENRVNLLADALEACNNALKTQVEINDSHQSQLDSLVGMVLELTIKDAMKEV